MSLKSLLNVSQTALPFQGDWNSNAASSYWPYLVTATLFILLVYSQRDSYPDLPRLNPKKPTELTWRGRLLDWMGRSAELLDEGRRQFPDRPYKIFTEAGDTIMIPPKYVHELKSNRALEFGQPASEVSSSSGSGCRLSDWVLKPPFTGPPRLSSRLRRLFQLRRRHGQDCPDLPDQGPG